MQSSNTDEQSLGSNKEETTQTTLSEPNTVTVSQERDLSSQVATSPVTSKKPPVALNFHVCGTQISATNKGSASVRAMGKFENSFIITGVGSASKRIKNPKGHKSEKSEVKLKERKTNSRDRVQSYLTPGTFGAEVRTDENNKKEVVQKAFFNKGVSLALEALYTSSVGIPGLGFIRGTGEESSIELAMAQIEAQIHNLAQQAETKDSPIILNLSGYSRGGASVIKLAHRINELYGSRFEINLHLIDPNAGAGRHASPVKTVIPRFVKKVNFTFSTKNPDGILASRGLEQYTILGDTEVNAVYLPGDHKAQDIFKKGQERPGANLPAEANQYFLERFLASNGAKCKEGAELIKEISVSKNPTLEDNENRNFSGASLEDDDNRKLACGTYKDNPHPVFGDLIGQQESKNRPLLNSGLAFKTFNAWKNVEDFKAWKKEGALHDLSKEIEEYYKPFEGETPEAATLRVKMANDCDLLLAQLIKEYNASQKLVYGLKQSDQNSEAGFKVASIKEIATKTTYMLADLRNSFSGTIQQSETPVEQVKAPINSSSSSIDEFKQCLNIKGVSYNLQMAIACVGATLKAFSGALVMAVIGAAKGIFNSKLPGFAAFIGFPLGLYYGAKLGARSGINDFFSTKQNMSREIAKHADKLSQHHSLIKTTKKT